MLSNTRVPIIKVCEKPPPDLHQALRKAFNQPAEPDNPGELNTAASTIANILREGSNPQQAGAEEASMPDGDKGKQVESLIQELNQLAQDEDEDLSQYYRRARLLLTQLGGRDWTFNIAEPPSNDQQIILDAVSRHFVNGLADVRAKVTLSMCKPLDMSKAHSTSPRSLLATYTYAEADHLASAWDYRSITEVDEQKLNDGLDCLRQWRVLTEQEWPNHIEFTKQLDKLHRKLAAIPSIQLCILHQRQDEIPKVYAMRANMLLCRTLGIDPQDRMVSLEARYPSSSVFLSITSCTESAMRGSEQRYQDAGRSEAGGVRRKCSFIIR